jgi:hypothetical protein
MGTRLTRFDMTIDEFPMNWYRHIPEFSTNIQRVLEKYYTEHQAPVKDHGKGVNMTTNVKPRHLELHLSNVTILDVLNFIAAKQFDWAREQNESESKKGIYYPVYPVGWQVDTRPNRNLPLRHWTNSVFSNFPQRRLDLP